MMVVIETTDKVPEGWTEEGEEKVQGFGGAEGAGPCWRFEERVECHRVRGLEKQLLPSVLFVY